MNIKDKTSAGILILLWFMLGLFVIVKGTYCISFFVSGQYLLAGMSGALGALYLWVLVGGHRVLSDGDR